MYACGYRSGVLNDVQRLNWRGDGPRPLAWSAWYPVQNESDDGVMREPIHGWFENGKLLADHPPSAQQRWPVVLLSHGTGGSPESLGWLAQGLAERGRVVLACHHHGNTSSEPYCAEGFLCWWERTRDLSRLLTLWSGQPEWRDALALDDVSAVGYSLGAHTALALGGALTSMERMAQWIREAGSTAHGPREFPDVADSIPTLLETSQVFRESWSRQGDDYRDGRVRAIVAIAPPPPVRAFEPDSLRRMPVPVHVIAGGADVEAPSTVGVQWLAEMAPAIIVYDAGAQVGHHTFLGLPSTAGLQACPTLFQDAPGVARAEVHRQVLDIVWSAVASHAPQALSNVAAGPQGNRR